MKIQNLTVVFLVIAIPIIMVLSYYLHMQQQTLRIQIEYDTKLSQSTKEAAKAYETNMFFRDDIKERDIVQASVNTFLTSLSNTLNVSGTAKEYMSNYTPALIAGLYDGYYMFYQVGEPVVVKTDGGIQLYYNSYTGKIEDLRDDDSIVIYEPAEGETAKTSIYNGKNIYFVTDSEKARKTYKPVLGAKNPYTARYTKYNNTNVVVKYTLDNRIYVHGKVSGRAVDLLRLFRVF